MNQTKPLALKPPQRILRTVPRHSKLQKNPQSKQLVRRLQHLKDSDLMDSSALAAKTSTKQCNAPKRQNQRRIR